MLGALRGLARAWRDRAERDPFPRAHQGQAAAVPLEYLNRSRGAEPDVLLLPPDRRAQALREERPFDFLRPHRRLAGEVFELYPIAAGGYFHLGTARTEDGTWHVLLWNLAASPFPIHHFRSSDGRTWGAPGVATWPFNPATEDILTVKVMGGTLYVHALVQVGNPTVNKLYYLRSPLGGAGGTWDSDLLDESKTLDPTHRSVIVSLWQGLGVQPAGDTAHATWFRSIADTSVVPEVLTEADLRHAERPGVGFDVLRHWDATAVASISGVTRQEFVVFPAGDWLLVYRLRLLAAGAAGQVYASRGFGTDTLIRTEPFQDATDGIYLCRDGDASAVLLLTESVVANDHRVRAYVAPWSAGAGWGAFGEVFASVLPGAASGHGVAASVLGPGRLRVFADQESARTYYGKTERDTLRLVLDRTAPPSSDGFGTPLDPPIGATDALRPAGMTDTWVLGGGWPYPYRTGPGAHHTIPGSDFWATFLDRRAILDTSFYFGRIRGVR